MCLFSAVTCMDDAIRSLPTVYRMIKQTSGEVWWSSRNKVSCVADLFPVIDSNWLLLKILIVKNLGLTTMIILWYHTWKKGNHGEDISLKNFFTIWQSWNFFSTDEAKNYIKVLLKRVIMYATTTVLHFSQWHCYCLKTSHVRIC